MSILGLGFDATDIPRVRDVYARYGDRFLHRVFTDGEIAYCTRHRDPVPSLAARFAAKEATMKALGHGWGRYVGWLDVEVVRAEDGRPTLRLHGKAAATARSVGATRLHLALTHTRDTAVAQVVLEDDGRP